MSRETPTPGAGNRRPLRKPCVMISDEAFDRSTHARSGQPEAVAVGRALLYPVGVDVQTAVIRAAQLLEGGCHE